MCQASLADVLLTTRAELQVEVRRMAGSRDAAGPADHGPRRSNASIAGALTVTLGAVEKHLRS